MTPSGDDTCLTAVIPAPVRFDIGRGRGLALRPGTPVRYADTSVAPTVERFCAQVTRRTGLPLAPMASRQAADEPSVRIELAAEDELGSLPAPIGISPTGADPADERHLLIIGGDQVVVRAVEPVGVACGLTTLIQPAPWTGPDRDAVSRGHEGGTTRRPRGACPR
jgi:hypothetical protein